MVEQQLIIQVQVLQQVIKVLIVQLKDLHRLQLLLQMEEVQVDQIKVQLEMVVQVEDQEAKELLQQVQ
ncbi:MAG: hypothetical protein CMG80_05210 [Marinobacter sp.]|nr:hypothetical protein [Marinobacter sp.]